MFSWDGPLSDRISFVSNAKMCCDGPWTVSRLSEPHLINQFLSSKKSSVAIDLGAKRSNFTATFLSLLGAQKIKILKIN